MHERHGGFDSGACAEMDRLARLANTDHRDGTDYTHSGTRSFRAHWTRRISGGIVINNGRHIRERANEKWRAVAGRRRGHAHWRRQGQHATLGEMGHAHHAGRVVSFNTLLTATDTA